MVSDLLCNGCSIGSCPTQKLADLLFDLVVGNIEPGTSHPSNEQLKNGVNDDLGNRKERLTMKKEIMPTVPTTAEIM